MNKVKILKLIKQYYKEEHKPEKFIPGKTKIHYAGRIYDENEMMNLVDSALDFWLTSGKYDKIFSEKLEKIFGSYVLTTNSGTSANLLAMSSIAERGKEVITTACAFPTTVASIVQCGMTPVFVDVNSETYNAEPALIRKAINRKTKAIILAHTMGYPFAAGEISEICDKYNIKLIEDNCDSLGARFGGKLTGTFGDLSTLSFYPAHHITTGEGGAVITKDLSLWRKALSFRDWGRDCYCNTGHDNTCGKRFTQKFGKLPMGYDHKFVYSHLGYNMKMTDMQAAIGCAQLDKLQDFIRCRQENFMLLDEIFRKYEKYFILPKIHPNADPSPFGYILTIKDDAPFQRKDLIYHLEINEIQTRPLFAGNIIKQPCFENVKYRIVGKLTNTDKIMNDTFWLGVYPGITNEMIDYISKIMERTF